MMVCLEWYYLLLIANSLSSDPASHMSTGVHQEIGDCNVRAADLSGHMRQVYLCPESHSQVNNEIRFMLKIFKDGYRILGDIKIFCSISFLTLRSVKMGK